MRRTGLIGGMLVGVCLAVLTGARALDGGAVAHGQVMRAVRVNPGVFQVLLDGRDGRAFLSGVGPLQVVDTAHGALVRTVTFAGSMAPPEVRLDDQDARVFMRTRGPGPRNVGGVDAVHLLDARTGQPLGVLSLPAGESVAQFAVVPQTSRVFVLTPARHLYVFDARTGRRVAASVLSRGAGVPPAAPANPADTLVVDQRTGRVVATESDQGTVFALDGASGHVLWATALPARGGPPPVLWLPVVDEQQGHLFVDDTRSGTVRMLDLRSGRLGHYTAHVNPGRVDMLAVGRTGRIFVFDGGRVSVLDAMSGRLVRAGSLGAVYQFGPARVVQRTGSVLIQDSSTNTLLLLDGTSGRIKRTVHLASFAMLTVDEHAGHILINSAVNGRTSPIAVLDARSGNVLRPIPISVGPGLSAVAIDDRTGEIAVVSDRPMTVPDRWAWVPSRLRSVVPFLRRPAPTQGASLSIIDPAS